MFSYAENTNNIKAKIVLLGDTGVGKSSLVVRFTSQRFFENREPTIGAAFFTKNIIVGRNTIDLQIWDTAGQERFHCLTPMYCRGASTAVVVYDITNIMSFIKAKKWVSDLQSSENYPKIIIVLVCNKVDLATNLNHIDEGKHFAEVNNILFIETSAKNNFNVDELFQKIAENVPITRLDQSNVIIVKESKPGYSCCYK